MATANPRRVALAAAALAALAALPLAGAGFYLELATKVLVLAIFAMSLDLLVGCTGLVSFGHAAFYGVGAYALALAAPRYEAVSLWWTLPASVAAAALAALVVGALVVRVRGVYFIMATLAFAQMFYFAFHDTDLGRGSDGISMTFKPTAALAGARLLDLDRPAHVYWLVLAAAALVLFFMRTGLDAPLGRALQGICHNEQRMRSLGFPVYRYKLASFTIAGAVAGLAGYLGALQYGFVNPELLSWHQSGNVLLMLILGGQGGFYGAALGAFSFVALQELFQAVTPRWQLLLGATILVLVLALPGGLGSAAGRLRHALFGASDA